MDHPINQDWLSRDGMPVRIASGTGPYQCRLQAIGQDGVPVDDSGITDTLTAYDLNGAAHAEDEMVWVKPSPIPDPDGKTIYLIVSGGSANAELAFWAEITDTYDSAGYQWKRLYPDADGSGFIDTPSIIGDELYDPNGIQDHPVGLRVYIRRHGTSEGDAPTYLIVGSDGGNFFPVLVKWNAGSDGNSTTYATWTYDLYPLGDTGYTLQLNSGGALQPENSPARIAMWSVSKAPDGTVGHAYFDASGNIQLYTCRERIGGQKNCT
jgi:hypothetical protein